LALALSKDVTLRETRFSAVGKPVYVRGGPMNGMHGELVRFCGKNRLLIRVSFIGKAAELEIDEAFIEPML
jgi:hypothetical protein